MTHKKKKRNIITKKDKIEVFINSCINDDLYMSIFFEDNLEVTQLVVNILLNRKDLIVKSVKTQIDLNNLLGKGIKLDILAKTETGEYINIEIQNIRNKYINKRARYYSSMLDINSLKKGDKYEKLKDNYVIFVLNNEKSIGKNNIAIYNYDRYSLEINKPLNDGSHIIIVNGNYQGDDDVGKLMHDFKQVNSKDMHFEILRKRNDELKELIVKGEISETMNKALNKLLKKAKAIGMEEGESIGEARGRSEGEARGEARGRSEGQKITYKNMLKEGRITQEEYNQFVLAIEM